MFHEKICSHYSHLQAELDALSKQLQIYPSGDLHYSMVNQKYVKWYQYVNGKQVFISNKDRLQLESLSAKKYLSLRHEEIVKEICALQLYLKNYQPSHKADELLADSSYFKPFLLPYFSVNSDNLKKWCSEEYEKNPYYPDGLIFKGFSENYVRSKSEAIIDIALTTNHIPFRYECKLQLGEYTFFPDFTILNPLDQKIYYWEHLGKIDVPDYFHKTQSKLSIYANNKIYPNINLITTCETMDNPLNADYVNTLIHHFFMP